MANCRIDLWFLQNINDRLDKNMCNPADSIRESRNMKYLNGGKKETYQPIEGKHRSIHASIHTATRPVEL